MTNMVIKRIDPQGRLSLPPGWRNSLKRREVIVVELDNKVEIFPVDSDLSKYIDSVKVADIKNFSDYHKLRQELVKKMRR